MRLTKQIKSKRKEAQRLAQKGQGKGYRNAPRMAANKLYEEIVKMRAS